MHVLNHSLTLHHQLQCPAGPAKLIMHVHVHCDSQNSLLRPSQDFSLCICQYLLATMSF